METYILIFPLADRERWNGWVRIINVHNLHQVQSFADQAYTRGYAAYKESDFHEDEYMGHYPKGCIEEIDFKHWQDYVT